MPNSDICWLDLETRSKVNLPKRGLLNYAQDLSTEVICMSYAFGDGPVNTWFAEDGPFPQEVIDHINYRGILYAHNAAFERHLFDFVLANDCGFTSPKLEQWRCSSARAMAHGLPGSLADVCRALDIPLQKQTEGTRLIRDYSIYPYLPGWKDNDKQLMQDYCEMDVMTMRQFCSVLRELSDEEWEQYHITEQMNDRGVPVDVSFAEAALHYSEEIKSDVDLRIRNHTEGAVKNSRARKTRDQWVLPQLTKEQIKLITRKRNKEEKISFDQRHREQLAAADSLPLPVAQFLELLEEAGGSAVSKYSAMSNLHVDGRVYGAMVWNGAGATGRYSSKGLQLQNFKRDVLKDPIPYIDRIINKKPVESPSKILGRLCRSAIHYSHGLTFSDYSQIEARVLPWLADEPSAETTLDVFREGRDIYVENAVGMFNVPADQVEPDMRQAAKQGVLACGFGGGAGAVQAMARGYGQDMDFDSANNIKSMWRSANPWAENLWYGLKDAAKQAVQFPQTPARYKRITFMYDGSDWLWMMLPSGRCLAYFRPRFEEVEYPWGDTGVELTCLWGGGKPKVKEKWPRRTLNHLILSENATQATAADLMRETIVRAHKAGLNLLFSVHDELVVEGHCADQLTELMVEPPAWAAGLPINADTQESYRYGK